MNKVVEIQQHPKTLDAWVTYIESIHATAIDLGLDRLKEVMKNLLFPKLAPLVITVAGTNGKGTTCALLESVLLDAGYQVGVYSSPHLLDYKERVRINNKLLTNQQHCDAFAFIESQRGNTTLSFFEYATLAAFYLFLQYPLDVVILEVGLGGRLDATNVVDPDISVITSLGLDHTEWLGNTLEEIGHEKAGIFRAGHPAVCGEPHPPASVAAFADQIGAKLYQLGYQFSYGEKKDNWHWKAGSFDLFDLPIPAIPINNAATALMVLGLTGLAISDENIVAGLKNVQVVGRFQQITSHPRTILDVAHNPHAAHYLASKLAQLDKKSGRLKAVVGMLKDKDTYHTLAEVSDYIDEWYLADIHNQRGAEASLLKDNLDSLGVKNVSCYNAPINAWHQAKKEANEDDILLVFGSFYTVSDIYAEIIKDPCEHE